MIEQEVQCKNKQEMKYKQDNRIYHFWLPLGNNEELNNVKKKDDWIGYPFVESSKEVSNIPGSYVAMEIGTELLFSLIRVVPYLRYLVGFCVRLTNPSY